MRLKLLLLLTLIAIIYPLTALAESLTVSLQVGATQISFSGYTSPNSQIIIKENNTIIGTTLSEGSGNWQQTLTVISQDPLHTYALSSTDSSGRTTSTITYNVNISGNSSVAISHITLPPTISLSGNTLFGSSHPEAIVTISLDNSSQTLNVSSDGSWSFDLTSFTAGPYRVYATNSVNGYLSLPSVTLSYTYSPSDVVSGSPTPSPSALTPTPTPTPVPFFISLYDVNQDGRFTLSELFTIIKNWLTQHLPCDLNHDSVCNLIDLSILLYYFDR